MKQRFDRGTVKGDAVITEEGYIRANAVVTRTGIFLYQNADGTTRKELRHPDDVWEPESLKSMELIPITNGHPNELVTAKNAKELTIGFTGQSIAKDGEFLTTNLVITDVAGVEAITKDGRKELSLGYVVELDEIPGEYNGERYDSRQKNIRYNHLSIVDKARAGSAARLALDGAIEIINEDKEMSKKKIKIDEEEIMVEETVAEYVDKLKKELDDLKDEKEEIQEEIDEVKKELEKVEGERDSAKAKIEEDKKDSAGSKAKNDEAFAKAVRERLALYKIAESHLDAEKISKLDSMTDAEIKKSVVEKCRKSINLDGKSEIYIQAMFDTIIDEKTQNVNLDNITFKKVDDAVLSPFEAQKKMIEKNKNAYKAKGGQ